MGRDRKLKLFLKQFLCICFGVSSLASVITWADPILVASVLPNSRSVVVGAPATLFATVLNAGSSQATGCTVSLPAGINATFTYQTTNSADNSPTGSANQPVDIPAGGLQTFVLTITPSQTIAAQELSPQFQCANAAAAGSITGVNTFTFAASNSPVPDVIALAATPTNDGIVELPSATGSNAFTVATVNVGAAGDITATAELSAPGTPATITLCETDPATALCINPTVPDANPINSTLVNSATPTFSFFVSGSGDIPFDPATNRVFVRFTDQQGEIRGATSVALRTGLPVPRLDDSFGTAGTLVFDAPVEDNGTSIQVATDSLVLADGKVLVAGFQQSLKDGALVSSELSLLRLNSDGSIDSTFANQGLMTVTAMDLALQGDFFFGATQVLELADGKLVLIAEFDDDILVLRYSANGELDTTFATQGFSRIDIAGREDEVYDAALTADGHILVAGQTDNPISATAGDPYIIQLTPQGDLDTSFGTNGVSIVSSPGTDIVNNRFNAMSVTQDGKIVAAGAVRNSFSFSVGDDILIARFLADGTPDSSFADNGVFIHDTNTNLEELLAVTVNTAGEVFATGERSNDLILLKLLEDGTLDQNFGDQGTVFVDVPDEQDNKQSNSGDAIFVQSNNTILVVGSFGSTANAGRLMVMMNFSSNGTLAASFGDGGTFPVDFDPQNNLSEGVGAASQDSEGRIIVSTNASTEEISESNIRISRFFVD